MGRDEGMSKASPRKICYFRSQDDVFQSILMCLSEGKLNYLKSTALKINTDCIATQL